MMRNQYGSKAVTTDPVPADKPDMRRYPRRRRFVEMTPVERKRWAVYRASTRPDQTRWRVAHGVVDRDGDTLTYTGKCSWCSAWFRCDRSPAMVRARWPRYCSAEHREIAKHISKRKSNRRVLNGETSGDRRPAPPEIELFDPSVPDVLWHALDIVEENITSSRQAYADASEWLEAHERSYES